MVEHRPDWCISRQRAWGVPIAIFVNKETGEPLKDQAVCDRVTELFVTEGADAWYARPASDFLGADYNADDYDQVFDIVDVWFESGSTHSFVLEDREELHSPADLYLEGSDQHRGWFHSSLLESCGTRGAAPYKTVLTHGFILDEKGYKMSKSLGNVVAPEDINKKWGADILRLWAVTSDYSQDVRIGDEIMKTTADIYRRIRNTLRFLCGALDGFDANEAVPETEFVQMPELERLVLHLLAEKDQEIRTMIREYRFRELAHTIHNFCANELSAFYLDIRKDRLYCDRPDLFERRAARTVMAKALECLIGWLAPILSFTAEETWSHRPVGLFGNEASVHLRGYAETNEAWLNAELAAKWQKVRQVRRVVLGALEPKRADKTIGSSLEAAPVVHISSDYASAFEGVDAAEVFITSQASVTVADIQDGDFTLSDVQGVGVAFAKAEGNKCLRCWKVMPEVGSDPDYPDLSPRDADAVRNFLENREAA